MPKPEMSWGFQLVIPTVNCDLEMILQWTTIPKWTSLHDQQKNKKLEKLYSTLDYILLDNT